MTDDTPSTPNRGGRPKKSPEEVRGTVTGYRNHGLRDPESRAAWAAYIAQRRKNARANHDKAM